MRHDVTVIWSRAGDRERWFATVRQPTICESFAKVERIDGQWWLIVYPRLLLRHRPALREHRILYRSPKTAKKHLEAWVRSCWPTIERWWGIYTPPRA